VTELTDWMWEEESMLQVERGFSDYMMQLTEAIFDDTDVETDSGFAFCGCEDCINREIFAYLMPKFLNLYRDGRIELEKPPMSTRIMKKLRLGRRKGNRKVIHGADASPTPKSITELFNVEPGGSDYLFMGPMHACICGCNVFHILASFGEGEIVQYFTEAKCASCGSIVRAPTQIDEEV